MKSLRCRALPLVLVLSLAPTLAARAAAQCAALDARFPGGFASFKADLNDNLGDYGTLFLNATSDCCAEKVQKLLYDKVYAQNHAAGGNGFRDRWLGGGDIYLISATALQLGAKGLLPPELDAEIQTALHEFNHVPNCAWPSNTCMDDFTVSAAGFGWAAAYEAMSGHPNDARDFAGQAQTYLDKTFSQTESVCLHRAGIDQSCAACLPAFSDADDLLGQISRDEVDVFSYNHGFANPNYGLGLLTSFSIGLGGLKQAKTVINEPVFDFFPTRLEAVIAEGLFREAQKRVTRPVQNGFCPNTWNSNGCFLFATVCSTADCGDPGVTMFNGVQEGPYSPAMYPVLDLFNDKFKIDGSLPLAFSGSADYQFNGFCADRFMTGNHFMSDGRLVAYRDLAWRWPYENGTPALAGPSMQNANPQIWVDSPFGGQTITGPTQFYGWAIDSDSGLQVQSIQFTLDGVPATLGGFTYGGTRPDVCTFFGLTKCTGCPVGWGGSFDPAGLSNGTHLLRATVTDLFGHTGTFDRSFVVNIDQPPTASFTSSCTERTCSFNGTGSTDDVGISSYAWSFGDGATGSGSTPSHLYGTSATFTVTLTVTDTAGHTASVSHPVTTTDPDLPPTASFTSPCSGRTCSFNAGGSSDDHGISSYFWTFGDGATGSGVTPNHTYGSSGSFTVTLTVTDTVGQTNATSHSVNPNLPPTAAFSSSCVNRTCSFNAGGSSDDLGISSYFWTFGDGGTGTGLTPSHTYSSSGTFNVTLTVTDTMGASSVVSHPVTPNLPPTAAFTFSCSARTCSFNGSGSSDDLGITSYSWTFGDGGTGSGVTPSHTYASAAAVNVTLTVADGFGATASTSLTVHPDLAPTAFFNVSCTGRACSMSATGSSDDLGITSYVWNFGDGSPAGSGQFPSHTYTVNGTYTITLTVTDTAGQTAQTTRTASAIDNPPFASFYVSCTGLTCTAVAEGSSDDVGIVNYTWAWGDGQTTSGGSPVSTSSHTYGSYATYTITLTVRDVVPQTSSVSQNVSLIPYPTAVFTFNCVGRTCTVNGTGSAGPAPIANYHWDWGDETTSDTTAPTAQHFYVYADAFQVILTVTDTAGFNGFASRTRRVGMADSVGIFDRSDGKFHLRSTVANNGINDKYLFFINAATGNQAVAGDWNGDGVRSGGKFNDATGEFALSNSLSMTSQNLPVDVQLTLQVPGTGRMAIAGDWNGDGVESAGLYDPATQTFYLRNSLTTGPADITLTFTGAASGWRPIAGDWDKDGIDSVGLYDPATSTFYLRNSNTTGGTQTTAVFGTAGTDRWPVVGDWDADGSSTIGLYVQSTHTFLLRKKNTFGPADFQFTDGTGADTPPVAGSWYMP